MTDLTDRLAPAFDLVERFVSAESVPGAGLAVAHGGQVAARVVGTMVPGRPAGPNTLWPLASITKLYTAATVMALVERGELALTTHVRRLLPAFTGDGRERITVRHLLTHTSGLIYEPAEMEQLLLARATLDDVAAVAYREPLRHPPGTCHEYSDLGYALLGRVAAVATGQAFPDLVRDLVLVPAGLSETFFPPPVAERTRTAKVVGAMAEGTEGAMYNSSYALDLAHPAFGAVATVEDLLRFGLAFVRGGRRFLSEAALRLMTTDQTYLRGQAGSGPQAGTVTPWGLGFELKSSEGFPGLASSESFGHGGASGCLLWIDPTCDAVIAFVSNRHYNLDQDRWIARVERVVNVVLAALCGATRPIGAGPGARGPGARRRASATGNARSGRRSSATGI